jgi:hypothetical protein
MNWLYAICVSLFFWAWTASDTKNPPEHSLCFDSVRCGLLLGSDSIGHRRPSPGNQEAQQEGVTHHDNRQG